ncbi:hypothetical protein SCLCIDRAFT_129963, partial [Scleroderma citrinum Foug A]
LKQRTYEWHGEMGDRAEKAVESFFDRYAEFSSPQIQESYVAWAVPEPEETINRKGRKVLVPLTVFPYMWQNVNDNDPENPVCYRHFC